MQMPEDADAVVSAIRLGWALAEVRGRNRPGGPAGHGGRLPSYVDHPLPLAPERTEDELRIHAQAVLAALASKLAVDSRSGKAPGRVQALDGLVKKLAAVGEDAAAASAAWQQLSEQIYIFDAHIQDCLTASSPMQASGYQLGRGLAECYWALDPFSFDNSAESWRFLLGDERCAELKRLARQLSAYLAPPAAPAIAGSLMAWRQVVVQPSWFPRDPGIAASILYRQVRVWHELVALGEDPVALLHPYARLGNRSLLAVAIRYFAGRLILVLVGVAGLVALVITLGTGTGTTLATTVLAILAAAGLSTAALSVNRFAQELNNELAALAVTTVPKPPKQSMIVKAIRQR
jgi:hypothetical protein